MPLSAALLGTDVPPWMTPYLLPQASAAPQPNAAPAPAPRPTVVQTAPDLSLALTGGGTPDGSNGTGSASGAPAQVPTDMLAQALMKNAFPEGPMYSALEPIGRLAELYAGTKGEQTYLQQRQKAVADFGNTVNSGDVQGAISAGLKSPLPEVQQSAMDLAEKNLYPQPLGGPNPISGIQSFLYKGQIIRVDAGGNVVGAGMASGGAASGQPNVPTIGVPSTAQAAPEGAQATAGTPSAGMPAAAAASSAPSQPPPAAPPPAASSADVIPPNGKVIGRSGFSNRVLFPDGHTANVNIYTGEVKDDPSSPYPTIQAARKELLDQNATFPTLRDATQQFFAAVPSGNQPITGPAAADAVTAFARVINPNAILKPGQGLDPATAAAALNLGFTDRMQSELQAALTGSGSISAETLNQMADVVRNSYSAADQTLSAKEGYNRKLAQQLGVPDYLMVPDLRAGFKLPPAAATTSASTGAPVQPMAAALKILSQNPTPKNKAYFKLHYGVEPDAALAEIAMPSQAPPAQTAPVQSSMVPFLPQTIPPIGRGAYVR